MIKFWSILEVWIVAVILFFSSKISAHAQHLLNFSISVLRPYKIQQYSTENLQRNFEKQCKFDTFQPQSPMKISMNNKEIDMEILLGKVGCVFDVNERQLMCKCFHCMQSKKNLVSSVTFLYIGSLHRIAAKPPQKKVLYFFFEMSIELAMSKQNLSNWSYLIQCNFTKTWNDSGKWLSKTRSNCPLFLLFILSKQYILLIIVLLWSFREVEIMITAQEI